jgi:hypothetical protein
MDKAARQSSSSILPTTGRPIIFLVSPFPQPTLFLPHISVIIRKRIFCSTLVYSTLKSKKEVNLITMGLFRQNFKKCTYYKNLKIIFDDYCKSFLEKLLKNLPKQYQPTVKKNQRIFRGKILFSLNVFKSTGS